MSEWVGNCVCRILSVGSVGIERHSEIPRLSCGCTVDPKYFKQDATCKHQRAHDHCKKEPDIKANGATTMYLTR